MSRSLNKAMIIGNLTRDVELRYTDGGTAVAKFGVATNRSWANSSGEKQEQVDFHNVVVWGKLGEIAGNLLQKGSKVYIAGRMQTRKYKTKDGYDRYAFEIVADEMILLGNGQGKSDEMKVAEESGIAEPPEDYQNEGDDVADEVPF